VSDRINTIVVVLDHDMAEDDADRLVDLFLHLRGVASVQRNVTDLEDYAARARVKSDFREKIFDLWKKLDER
jgi:hypothetical protein